MQIIGMHVLLSLYGYTLTV